MNVHDEAGQMKTAHRRLFDFTVDSNPLGPSNKAKAAIRKEVGHVDAPPGDTVRYLRAYVSRVEKVGEDCTVFGAGSTHLLELVLDTIRPHSAGVLSPPSPGIAGALARRQVAVEPVLPGTGDEAPVSVRILSDRLAGVDMLILSNPHGVTGRAFSSRDAGALIEEAARQGKILVIDEGLRDYGPLDSPVAQAVSSPSTIILRSFSFFHALKGLRLGYGIGPAGLVRQVEERKPSLGICSLAPRAALASLRDSRYRERTLAFIADEKAYMIPRLSGQSGVEVLGAPLNFVLLSIRKEWEDLYRSLLEHNILIDGWRGPDGTARIRVPMRSHKLNAYFVRVMRVITGG